MVKLRIHTLCKTRVLVQEGDESGEEMEENIVEDSEESGEEEDGVKYQPTVLKSLPRVEVRA